MSIEYEFQVRFEFASAFLSHDGCDKSFAGNPSAAIRWAVSAAHVQHVGKLAYK